MEALGPKIRRQRRRLGLTLDDLAGRTGVSKPYLSLIETGRVPNPPSDEKLRRLEQTLGFPTGELLSQAHLQRTPRDVRAMLRKLVGEDNGRVAALAGATSVADRPTPAKGQGSQAADGTGVGAVDGVGDGAVDGVGDGAVDFDDAYLSGVLQEDGRASAGNVERVTANVVPVINRVSAGYPKDFTDLGYPPRVADDYVGCPDVHDKDAFAARVHGDSMAPKYRQGDIVIFSPALSPREGDDCFVRFDDGQTTFKRVFFETGDRRRPGDAGCSRGTRSTAR